MDKGIRFEKYCCKYLEEKGFITRTTVASGDQGVDIIAEKDGVVYAIQCKYRVAGSIGNDAIQQIIAGKDFYDCDIAVVMTNAKFSTSAIRLAEKLRVRLWDSIEMESDTEENEAFSELNAISEIENEAHEFVLDLQKGCDLLETSFIGQTDSFSTACSSITEGDCEEYINRVFLNCGLKTKLIKKYTLLNCFTDLYYFEVFEGNSLDRILYEIASKLSDNGMVIERVSTRNAVVAKRRISTDKENVDSEKNKHKDKLLSKKISGVIESVCRTEAIFLAKGRTEKSNSDSFLFHINEMINENQINTIESTLNRKYKNTFRISKLTDYSIKVFVVGDRLNFDFDEVDCVGVYPDPCEIGSHIFVSYYSNPKEKIVNFCFLLRNICIDKVLNSSTCEPIDKSLYFFWYDICYYLHCLFELVSGAVIRDIVADGLEPYFDLHGIPLYRSRRNCFHVRVLDNKGNVIRFSEITNVGGVIISSLGFDAFLCGEVDKCFPIGSGLKRVDYTVLQTFTDMFGTDRDIPIFRMNEDIQEMGVLIKRLMSILEMKRNIIESLFDSFCQSPNIDVSVNRYREENIEVVYYSKCKEGKNRETHSENNGDNTLVSNSCEEDTSKILSVVTDSFRAMKAEIMDMGYSFTCMDIIYQSEHKEYIIYYIQNHDEMILDVDEYISENSDKDIGDVGKCTRKAVLKLVKYLRERGCVFNSFSFYYDSNDKVFNVTIRNNKDILINEFYHEFLD